MPRPVTTLLDLTRALFQGRDDVYADAFPRQNQPGKVNYALVKEPLTDAVLAAHLAGKRLIGQYQLLPDSTVHWFALDFDADDDGTPVLQQALAQQERFSAAGLQTYLERSRSGRGAHLWGFLSEPVPAVEVRHALRPLLVEAASFDRLYPVQTSVSEGRPYGNLIALPFFGAEADIVWTSPLGPGVLGGASVFLNTDTLLPIDPAVFCESVLRNNRAVIAELLANVPPEKVTSTALSSYTATEVVPWGEMTTKGRPEKPYNGVLRLVSDYGCRFMQHAFLERAKLPEPQWYAAVQQLTCFQNGREAAHLISRGHPSYTPADTDQKFTQALRHPPVGCAYIHEHFPELACKGCAMKAPYHVGTQPIRSLVKESEEPMVRSDYKQALTRMRRRQSGADVVGVEWGTAGLDQYTRLRPKELTVIGARPSVGKTALLVDAAVNLASRGVPVMLFSAETGQEGLEDRLLARVSGVDSKAIRGERRRNGEVWPVNSEEERIIEAAAKELAQLPIFVHYTAANPDLMLNLMEDVILREKIDMGQPMVMFFDYLQFTSMDKLDAGFNEYEYLSRATQEFKYLAKVIRQPVVVFSQLKRDVEGDETPGLDAFKGTGRIEADADVAMLLSGERIPGPIAKRKLTIAKQREGDAGVAIDLLLHQTICRFEAQSGALPTVPKDIFADDSAPSPFAF